MTIGPASISYPVGVKALLPEEAARRRRIEHLIVDALEDASYREVILPIVDFVDPYSGVVSARTARQSYRFTDREGELVQVRSDFTPMLARAIAPGIDRSLLPLRLFYRGDVIRYEQTRLGQNREFFQIGGELIGSSSVDGDVEMLSLAAKTVFAAGRRATITFTDATLFPSIVRGANLGRDEEQTLRSAIANKRTSDLQHMKSALPAGTLRLLEGMSSGRLSLRDLEGDEETIPVAARLGAISAALAGVEEATFELHLDDLDEDPGYYSGVRFRIFTDVRRLPAGQGGRYDTLYRRFGSDVSAIGFTLSVDYLEAAV